MARTKTVFSSHSQLAHVWAQGEHPRGKAGNMFFEGERIYSWGTHYLAARLITLESGRMAALVNEYRYSVSTGQHLGHIYNALHGLRMVFTVANPDARTPAEHQANLDGLQAKVGEAYSELLKARAYHEYRRSQLYRLLTAVEEYASAFNLPVPPQGVDWHAVSAAEARQGEFSANRANKAEEREQAARKAKRDEILTQAKAYNLLEDYSEARLLLAWRRGEVVAVEGQEINLKSLLWALECQELEELPKPPSSYDSTWGRDTMLCVRGEEVHTTRGARVPLKDARRLYGLIERVRASGQDWQRNATSQEGNVGHFKADRISAQGDLWAGCHYIKAQEIQDFAKAVGWAE